VLVGGAEARPSVRFLVSGEVSSALRPADESRDELPGETEEGGRLQTFLSPWLSRTRTASCSDEIWSLSSAISESLATCHRSSLQARQGRGGGGRERRLHLLGSQLGNHLATRRELRPQRCDLSILPQRGSRQRKRTRTEGATLTSPSPLGGAGFGEGTGGGGGQARGVSSGREAEAEAADGFCSKNELLNGPQAADPPS
jgi:hypothetical protein